MLSLPPDYVADIAPTFAPGKVRLDWLPWHTWPGWRPELHGTAEAHEQIAAQLAAGGGQRAAVEPPDPPLMPDPNVQGALADLVVLDEGVWFTSS